MTDTALPDKLEPGEAEEQGFTIDRHCYPWIAYKGSRFNPTEVKNCFTDDEAMLLSACWQFENGIADLDKGFGHSGRAHLDFARSLRDQVRRVA